MPSVCRAVMTPTTPYRALQDVATLREPALLVDMHISTFAADAFFVQMVPALLDPDFLTPQPVPQLVSLSPHAGM